MAGKFVLAAVGSPDFFSTGLLACPHSRVVGFPRVSNIS